MADEANAPVAAEPTAQVDETTRPEEAAAESTTDEAKPAEGGDVGTSADAPEETKPNTEDSPADAANATTTDANDASAAKGDDTASTEETPAANGTPASKKANNAINRRKSGGAVPEHKKKTPKGKGKKELHLRLDVHPGEMYMVAMRGYQPWPVIICDEEMLPESLISKRPVSAKRIDGTYRPDFAEGGKNAKDRRYPVMFLGTNEFAWQVNTELLDFDFDQVKSEVDNGINQKKTKNLWHAYEIAAQGHDLEHFKQMLADHDAAMQDDAQKREEKAQEKAAKKEKAAKRKSAAAESEDVEMEDAGDTAAPSAKKAKGTKKRKKDDESDGENEKPAKTPKTKLKLTNKPKESSTKKETKPKKSKKESDEEAEPAQPEEPPMSEAERIQKREKSVLYLRHRLQKGFLARDQAPKDEDMSNMNDYLRQLEAHNDLEAQVIKNTKVHKVLRAILKLDSIPKDDEFQFKKRSSDLLNLWRGKMAVDTDAGGEAPAAPTSASAEPPVTNGVNHDDAKKPDSTDKTEEPEKVEEKSEETKDKLAEAASTKTTDGDGDVPMAEKEEVPASKADAEPKKEPVAEVAQEATE